MNPLQPPQLARASRDTVLAAVALLFLTLAPIASADATASVDEQTYTTSIPVPTAPLPALPPVVEVASFAHCVTPLGICVGATLCGDTSRNANTRYDITNPYVYVEVGLSGTGAYGGYSSDCNGKVFL